MLLVQPGPVLTYVHDRTAYEIAPAAWRMAGDLADRLFGSDHRPRMVDVAADTNAQAANDAAAQ